MANLPAATLGKSAVCLICSPDLGLDFPDLGSNLAEEIKVDFSGQKNEPLSGHFCLLDQPKKLLRSRLRDIFDCLVAEAFAKMRIPN
jgi:hypothetical protein